MRIAIVSSPGEVYAEDLKYILKLLERLGIEARIDNNIAKLLNINGCDVLREDADYIIIIGGDKTILRTLLSLKDREVPVIGLSGRGTKSFLATSTLEDFDEIIKRVIKGDYEIIKRIRIEAEVNGESLPPALNEIAIFARLSGKMVRYSLIINDDYIWRDEGDGVIISTPTGSTAYALSAGGVIITCDSDVLEIVPVNSTILAHKPIVTSASNTIIIDGINPQECTLIIDGQLRKNIDSSRVTVRKARHHVKFVNFPKDKYSVLYKKLKRRILSLNDDVSIKNLPPSSKLVLKVLSYEGPLTTKEIIRRTGLPQRTVSYALRLLLKNGLVIRKSYSRDSRQKLYMINYLVV